MTGGVDGSDRAFNSHTNADFASEQRGVGEGEKRIGTQVRKSGVAGITGKRVATIACVYFTTTTFIR